MVVLITHRPAVGHKPHGEGEPVHSWWQRRREAGRMSEERGGENVCPTLTPSDLLAPSRALVFYRGMRLGPLDTISS